jgi:hypothetical protein
MREWDPIGVAEWPEAQDEYDGYIPHIVSLLDKGASEQEVAKYLDAVATERMELNPDRARSLATARALVRLWAEDKPSAT